MNEAGAFDSGFLATVAFYVASAVTIASAIITVTQRDLVRSVLALAMSFIGVASIYFILNAEFIGVVQILVYVGAISILIAFAVMFIGDLANAGTLSQNRLFSAVAAVLMLAAIVFVSYNTDWTAIDSIEEPDALAGLTGNYQVVPVEDGEATITAADADTDGVRGGALVNGSSHIGPSLVRELILPFETLGLLLVAALIGALIIIRNRREEDDAV